MKIWKLVSGILSIVLFVFVAFQSCAAGLANSLSENGEVSGSAGIIVAFFMLAGGIVSIVTRNSEKKGGNIALIILFGLAALVGAAAHGSFSDLAVWAGWCAINAVLAAFSLFKGKKKQQAS
jgi:Ca2+/Na+ antiporter